MFVYWATVGALAMVVCYLAGVQRGLAYMKRNDPNKPAC